MSTREIIKELEKQKSMLGTSVFDVDLLEKYLNLSATYKADIPETIDYNIHGVGSIKNITDKFQRLNPYKFTKPNFIRIKGSWSVFTIITRKTDLPVNVSVEQSHVKTHHKTPRYHVIDKAA